MRESEKPALAFEEREFHTYQDAVKPIPSSPSSNESDYDLNYAENNF